MFPRFLLIFKQKNPAYVKHFRGWLQELDLKDSKPKPYHRQDEEGDRPRPQKISMKFGPQIFLGAIRL